MTSALLHVLLHMPKPLRLALILRRWPCSIGSVISSSSPSAGRRIALGATEPLKLAASDQKRVSSSRKLIEAPMEATVEPSRLEFRGQDAEECETFINAVSRHVLSIGKQRDDQWVADFAFSCFTHDALRWWNTLGDDTQGSWKLLRKAMLSRYRPLFFGGGGEEAEAFVHMVRERALDEGKQSDNGWIVGFASACFIGEALRWHASLEPSVQTDWIRLQQALLLQYPRNSQGNLPNLIPTPAAAAAAPSLAPGPPSPTLAAKMASPSLATEPAAPILRPAPVAPTLGTVLAPPTRRPVPPAPTLGPVPQAPIPGNGPSARKMSRRGRIRATRDWDSTKYYVDLFIDGADTGLDIHASGTTLTVGWDWPCSDPQALTIYDSSLNYDTIGTRIGYLSQMELVPMRRKPATGLTLTGTARTDVFKGWKITELASSQNPGFDLVPMDEEGRRLYVVLHEEQGVLLVPWKSRINSFSLFLEPLS